MISFYLSIIETEEAKDKVVFIYENFYSFMCYSAGKVLNHNRHDVEDVVHNAMLKIIGIIDLIDLSDVKKVKNLCGIVARNKAIDYCKRSNSQTITTDDETALAVEDDATPDDIVISKEAYDIVIEAIRSLNDTYRDVCLLKYVHEYKVREIAIMLDLSENTVTTRLSRAKQILRKTLRKELPHV